MSRHLRTRHFCSFFSKKESPGGQVMPTSITVFSGVVYIPLLATNVIMLEALATTFSFDNKGEIDTVLMLVVEQIL